MLIYKFRDFRKFPRTQSSNVSTFGLNVSTSGIFVSTESPNRYGLSINVEGFGSNGYGLG
jgi:hypothetical protein